MTLRTAFCLHSQLLLNTQLCEEGGLRIHSIFMLLIAIWILLKWINIKLKQIHILSLTEPDSQWSSCIVDWKMQILITCNSQGKKSFKFWKTEGAWCFWLAWANMHCYTAMIILLLHISKGLWFKSPCSNFHILLNLTRWQQWVNFALWSQHLDISHKSNDSKTSGGFGISYRWEDSSEWASAVWLILKRFLSYFQSLIKESWGLL